MVSEVSETALNLSVLSLLINGGIKFNLCFTVLTVKLGQQCEVYVYTTVPPSSYFRCMYSCGHTRGVVWRGDIWTIIWCTVDPCFNMWPFWRETPSLRRFHNYVLSYLIYLICASAGGHPSYIVSTSWPEESWLEVSKVRGSRKQGFDLELPT